MQKYTSCNALVAHGLYSLGGKTAYRRGEIEY